VKEGGGGRNLEYVLPSPSFYVPSAEPKADEEVAVSHHLSLFPPSGAPPSSSLSLPWPKIADSRALPETFFLPAFEGRRR